jgi:glycosyltransferase involved in cell wall biosynthesis
MTMRIVHYQQHLLGPDSGTANAARGWAEALARAGADVSAIVDRSIARKPAPAGVRVTRLGHSLRGPFKLPRGISRALEGADVVVLHGGWLLGNVVVGRACIRQHVPFVLTTHGVYAPEVLRRRATRKRLWAAALERRHLQRAFAVHVFFREQVAEVERMGVAIRPVVAPNGISIPEGVRWDGGSGQYLLWLGRYDIETKGLDILLRALQRIPRSERPNVRLHGPDWRNQKQKLGALAQELDLDRWVTLGDPVYGDAKWELMRKATACVYPSRWDACPVAVSEAAAIGVPMLVTRYPLANLLASSGAAIQVDAEAPCLAAGIAGLLNADLEDLGRRAAELARRELSWDAVARSWLDQLQRLLYP